ncbi:FecR domain-containing protein [Chitinophaga horti]|uniref:FecR domain-containing protein n=1 Tax=Chitinophaga horti TaxID=2920382 RepID=A0ABY6J388_9BACT|nr:FecR family protein [Chitinophaga horti]UYQ94133.1 FecR domain-containing protein [Chitinophaga horti]
MTDQTKLSLINKYKAGQLTEEEEASFFAWYREVTLDELHQLLQMGDQPPAYQEASPEFLAAMQQRLQEPAKVRKLQPRLWWAAAAVLLVAGSVYLLRPATKPVDVVVTASADVAPGKNGAVLTLANGQQVSLDSLADGVVANQQGTNVVMQNGSLHYHADEASGSAYNTISTPPARQFRLTLPDGSLVWLNAKSSIRYPTAFTGANRTVEVNGEAYFEVAKNAARPFRVQLKNATVEVLGTHFNLNAYDDEPSVRATLLEGSIRAVKGTEGVVLQPGQQADIETSIRVKENINTNQVVAWKDGTFNFDQLGVEEVMRQLSRWYDIEIVYEKGVPVNKFYGEIGRNLNLSQVLDGLKASGVNFRIEENKRLIVLP